MSYHVGEKVRDVQFNPNNEFLLLTSNNTGSIKLYDTRMFKSAVNEYIEHEVKKCFFKFFLDRCFKHRLAS